METGRRAPHIEKRETTMQTYEDAILNEAEQVQQAAWFFEAQECLAFSDLEETDLGELS